MKIVEFIDLNRNTIIKASADESEVTIMLSENFSKTGAKTLPYSC